MRQTRCAIVLCFFALWMQLLAPAAALSMRDGADPFSTICSRSTAGNSLPTTDHRDHQHCPLCQATVASPPPGDRMPIVAPARPIVRRLAWRPSLARAPPGPVVRRAQPRGPPSSI